MKKRRSFRRLSGHLDLPADVTEHESLITVMGVNMVRAENHDGLLECTPQAVGVRMRDRITRICGDGLTIREMTADALEVKGEIKSIDFLTRGAENVII